TAFPEAGHAVAPYCSPTVDPVKHITIVPAGRTGGVTVMIPEKDSSYDTRNSMFDRIVVALGGRVAEELKLDDISSGASSDISHATAIARNMVTKYGMSEKLGTVLYGSEHSNDEVFLGRDFSSGKNYSEATAAEIDAEIKNIIDKAYRRCAEILYEHSDKLQKLAEYLIKVETVDGDQFKALMEGDPTFEELDEIAEEKRRKSQKENDARRKKEEEERKKREAEEAKRQAEMRSHNIGGVEEPLSEEKSENEDNKE
ncbi:MAG: zinc metalloprotease, partial [Ruminococcaceae bacterium]|nr:zinc metalloprotease [Oscillospiraceae bacterium]